MSAHVSQWLAPAAAWRRRRRRQRQRQRRQWQRIYGAMRWLLFYTLISRIPAILTILIIISCVCVDVDGCVAWWIYAIRASFMEWGMESGRTTLRWTFDWRIFHALSADSAIIFYGSMHNSIFHDNFFFLVGLLVFRFSLRLFAEFTNSRPVMCGTFFIFNTYLKTCVYHFICLPDAFVYAQRLSRECSSWSKLWIYIYSMCGYVWVVLNIIQIQSEHKCT